MAKSKYIIQKVHASHTWTCTLIIQVHVSVLLVHYLYHEYIIIYMINDYMRNCYTLHKEFPYNLYMIIIFVSFSLFIVKVFSICHNSNEKFELHQIHVTPTIATWNVCIFIHSWIITYIYNYNLKHMEVHVFSCISKCLCFISHSTVHYYCVPIEFSWIINKFTYPFLLVLVGKL